VCVLCLQGKCNNSSCPYLHIKVAADAPPCKDFLAGYCPRGAACTHKHLTQRMAKQLEQQQTVQAAAAAAGAQTTTTPAAASAGAAQPAATAAKLDRVAEQVAGQQQQQQQEDQQPPNNGSITPTAAAVGGVAGGAGDSSRVGPPARATTWEGLIALLPDASDDDLEGWE